MSNPDRARHSLHRRRCIRTTFSAFPADFCANAVAKAAPNGKVTRIAQSPDSDGLKGELDQSGEPIIRKGRLILSCFDLVTGPQMVNTKHEMTTTLPELEPR